MHLCIYICIDAFICIFHTVCLDLLCASESCSVMSGSLWPPWTLPDRLLCPRNSPGQNNGVGNHSLLQGTFPTQGLNPGLPFCRRTVYHLSHQVSPRIQEWVASPFSRLSFWPRNWTRVSCIADRFFTHWGTREAFFKYNACLQIIYNLQNYILKVCLGKQLNIQNLFLS